MREHLDTAAVKAALAITAAGLAVSGCTATPSPSGDTEPPTGGALATMEDWLGCETFGDFEVLQEYLGATGIDGQLQSDGLGEGIDAEAAGCAAQFDLATFEDTQGSFEFAVTGDAAVRAGLAPWTDESAASENFAERVDQRRQNLPGIEYTGESEGELGGEWDDSLYIAAETDNRFYLDAYGRHGDWVVYISIDILHDPGVDAHETAPEFYPDSSAEEMAVYPFTSDQIVDWVAQEYLPQIQSDIVQRADSEERQ